MRSSMWTNLWRSAATTRVHLTHLSCACTMWGGRRSPTWIGMAMQMPHCRLAAAWWTDHADTDRTSEIKEQTQVEPRWHYFDQVSPVIELIETTSISKSGCNGSFMLGGGCWLPSTNLHNGHCGCYCTSMRTYIVVHNHHGEIYGMLIRGKQRQQMPRWRVDRKKRFCWDNNESIYYLCWVEFRSHMMHNLHNLFSDEPVYALRCQVHNSHPLGVPDFRLERLVMWHILFVQNNMLYMLQCYRLIMNHNARAAKIILMI
jgi:hypothetical protein